VRVAEEVWSLAPERSESVVMVGRWGRTVWRVNLRTRRTVRVATIRPADGLSAGDGLTALATFADGSILVAGGVHYWQISQAGTVHRLPQTTVTAADEMVALPGQRFAATFGPNLDTIDARTGSVQELSTAIQDPIAPSGDGAILTSAKRDGRWAIVRVATDGTITPLTYAGPADADPLGAGDGLALGALPAVPFTNRPDLEGFRAGPLRSRPTAPCCSPTPSGPRRRDGLRALVPADSQRPRIALTQHGWDTLASGTVGYLAGVAGTVHADVRTRGDTLIVSAHATAHAGEGKLTLGARIPPGRYRLTLRLTTTRGAAASTAALDTRSALPVAQARAALSGSYAHSDGDEGGRAGVKVGECRRKAPRRVWCMLRAFETTSDLRRQPSMWGEASVPAGGATATLRSDGLHVGPATYVHDQWPYPQERVTLAGATRQHAGHQTSVGLTVWTNQATRVRLTVVAHWRDARQRTGRQAVTLAGDVTPNHPWRARVPSERAPPQRPGRGGL
jgi:hypothetical protein